MWVPTGVTGLEELAVTAEVMLVAKLVVELTVITPNNFKRRICIVCIQIYVGLERLCPGLVRIERKLPLWSQWNS